MMFRKVIFNTTAPIQSKLKGSIFHRMTPVLGHPKSKGICKWRYCLGVELERIGSAVNRATPSS